MSLLPSIDFELASLDGHRCTRNKRRRFYSQDPLVTTSQMTVSLSMCEQFTFGIEEKFQLVDPARELLSVCNVGARKSSL
jgi:hypothetical protein